MIQYDYLMAHPDLTFKRVLLDPTALTRSVWQIDKRAALIPASLELGLAVISFIVGVETNVLTAVETYALARLMLAASTLF